MLDVPRRRHGQLAVAQVLCEGGILELHRAVCQLRGAHPGRPTPQRVMLAATRGGAPECARSLAMSCGLLGDAAGRAALTLGAAGGVFITGPVVSSGQNFSSPSLSCFAAPHRMSKRRAIRRPFRGRNDANRERVSASISSINQEPLT